MQNFFQGIRMPFRLPVTLFGVSVYLNKEQQHREEAFRDSCHQAIEGFERFNNNYNNDEKEAKYRNNKDLPPEFETFFGVYREEKKLKWRHAEDIQSLDATYHSKAEIVTAARQMSPEFLANIKALLACGTGWYYSVDEDRSRNDTRGMHVETGETLEDFINDVLPNLGEHIVNSSTGKPWDTSKTPSLEKMLEDTLFNVWGSLHFNVENVEECSKQEAEKSQKSNLVHNPTALEKAERAVIQEARDRLR